MALYLCGCVDRHETQKPDRHETKSKWRCTCVDRNETQKPSGAVPVWIETRHKSHVALYLCGEARDTKAMWRYTCVDRHETQNPRGAVPVWISNDLLQQLHFQRLYPCVSLDEWFQHPANTKQRHMQLKQNKLTLKKAHLNSLSNKKILNATKLHLLH